MVVIVTTKGATVIFNKQAMKEAQQRRNKNRLERLGFAALISAFFYFGGAAIAGLVGLIGILYALSEIEAQLVYANFLKAHEIGLHDRIDD
jgi:hypothetical protein